MRCIVSGLDRSGALVVLVEPSAVALVPQVVQICAAGEHRRVENVDARRLGDFLKVDHIRPALHRPDVPGTVCHRLGVAEVERAPPGALV